SAFARLEGLVEERSRRIGAAKAAPASRENPVDGGRREKSVERVPRSPSGPEGPVREPVSIPRDTEIWETFNQECVEILDKLDRAILDLEASDRPKALLEGLAGLFHTLKGAANAVGLTPIGREVHLIEDFLEALVGAAILPPMRGVASLLLKVQSG